MVEHQSVHLKAVALHNHISDLTTTTTTITTTTPITTTTSATTTGESYLI